MPTRYFRIILILLTLCIIGKVEAVNLRITNGSGKPGERVSATINMTDGGRIGAGQFKLIYNAEHLSVVRADRLSLANTVGLGNNQVVTDNPGEIAIGWFNANPPTSASGSLIRLTFSIALNAPPGILGLQLTETLFTDVDINPLSVQTTDGQITVEGAESSTINLPVSGPLGYRPGIATDHPQQIAFEFRADARTDLIITFEGQFIGRNELDISINGSNIGPLPQTSANRWNRIWVYLSRNNLRSGMNVLELRHPINLQRRSGFGHWLIRNVYGWRPAGSSRAGKSYVTQSQPSALGLGAPYPSPFNASVTIPYSVAEDMPVRVSVYNLNGQSIAILYDGNQLAGQHLLSWEGMDAAGRAVSSGVYLIVFEASGLSQTAKVILLK